LVDGDEFCVPGIVDIFRHVGRLDGLLDLLHRGVGMVLEELEGFGEVGALDFW
jgi:hypothetical protein